MSGSFLYVLPSGGNLFSKSEKQRRRSKRVQEEQEQGEERERGRREREGRLIKSRALLLFSASFEGFQLSVGSGKGEACFKKVIIISLQNYKHFNKNDLL
jgi:hypothetical protein